MYSSTRRTQSILLYTNEFLSNSVKELLGSLNSFYKKNLSLENAIRYIHKKLRTT